jgi:hypothetical protein
MSQNDQRTPAESEVTSTSARAAAPDSPRFGTFVAPRTQRGTPMATNETPASIAAIAPACALVFEQSIRAPLALEVLLRESPALFSAQLRVAMA